MYIERDAKILLIYRSIVGIVTFSIFYLVFLQNQQIHPNDNFEILQLMIFSIIFLLLAIVIGSIISLKREISRQQEYINNIKNKDTISDKYVKVAYNKSGLYSIIIASILGIIAFLYIYKILLLDLSNKGITIMKSSLETFSLMIIIFVTVLIIILLVTFFILLKRIKTPLYYDFKSCPVCNSTNIFKVEYSWWGGLVSPALVHQVRCKKCGHTYNGVTGKNVSNSISIFILIWVVVTIILVILDSIF